MKKIPIDPPRLFNDCFTIVERNGQFGLFQYNTREIIACVFPEMRWRDDYLCIFNGTKWGVIRLDRLKHLCDNIERGIDLI